MPIVPPGFSPPTDTMRPGTAAAPVPPLADGSRGSRPQRPDCERLHEACVRVVAGRAAADGVHDPCQRGRREMLARCRPGGAPPAQRAQVEDQHSPGQALRVAPADHVQQPDPRDRSRRCGPCLGRRREPVPALPVEHEGRPQRPAVEGVAPDHVDPSPPGGGCGVVDGQRQVGKPPPRVPPRVVGVDSAAVAAVGEEPADDDDLVPERGRCDLGARLGERRPGHPGRDEQGEHPHGDAVPDAASCTTEG